MIVVFLDFDGVLNSADTMKQGVHLHPDFVVRLCRLCRDHKVNIVVSSSWRFIHTIEEIRGFLRVTGMFGSERMVIDKTPNLSGDSKRGDEIKAWLDEHDEVEGFIIIDDDSDMLAEQMPFFVQTSWESGFTEECCAKADVLLSAMVAKS